MERRERFADDLVTVTDVNESDITAISDTDAAADFVLENSHSGRWWV